MFQISQAIKRWRETKREEASDGSSLSKTITDLLDGYEKEREEARKKFPRFVSSLKEKSEEVSVASVTVSSEKMKVSEAKKTENSGTTTKEAPAPRKEKAVEVSKKVEEKATKAAKETEDEWDVEMRGFTDGLYEESAKQPENQESSFWESEEDSETASTTEDTEMDDINLENLLKSISEGNDVSSRGDGQRDDNRQRSHYRHRRRYHGKRNHNHSGPRKDNRRKNRNH